MNANPHDNILATSPAQPLSAYQRYPLSPPLAHTASSTVRLALTAVRRWWKLALPASVLLSSTGVALVYLSFSPVYEATTYLRVLPGYIVFKDAASTMAGNLKDLMRSRLLLSSVVGDERVARVPELRKATDPIERLAAGLSVSSIGGTEFVSVSYRSEDPEAAALVANHVSEAYVQLQNADERTRKEEVLNLLKHEQDFHEQTVSNLRGELEDLTKRASGSGAIVPPVEQDSPNDSVVAELNSRLVSVIVESAVLKAKLQAAKEGVPDAVSTPSESTLQSYIQSQPDVQRAETELRYLEETVRLTEQRAGKGLNLQTDVGYQRRVADRAKLERDVKEMKERYRGLYFAQEQLRSTDERRAELSNMEMALQGFQITQQTLKEQLAQQIKTVEVASGDSLNIEFKRAELDQATKVFHLISERIVQLQTEMRAPDRAEINRRAVTPTRPVENVPVKKMLMAGLALLAVPFGLCVGWEKLMDRVADPQQLEERAQMRVVGEVVLLPRSRRRKRSLTINRRDASCLLYEESVDSLRTCIVLSDAACKAQVVAFTSAISREGKTSLATQYAVSVARATRERVLLIDGDMRCPEVHRFFGLPTSPGLAEVLSGTAKFHDAVVTRWSDLLHVLPAGKLPDSPHKLLGAGALAKLLEQARKHYRQIVIDTPPVLAASEALVLAKEADAALVCTMRDYSRVPQVRAACQRLLDAGARPLGAVLSGVTPSHYRFRYGEYSRTG